MAHAIRRNDWMEIHVERKKRLTK